jgi:hypothetical protein
MKHLLLTLCLLLSFSSHSYELSEEQVIYETVISKSVNSDASAKVIVLNTTKPLYFKNTSSDELKSQFPNLPSDAIEKAFAKNSQSQALNWRSILTEISFISQQVKDNLAQSFYTYMKEQDADLYMEFSPVSFSKDHTHALLAVYQMCGVLCGSGSIVHLHKEKEGYWNVVNGITFLFQ